MPPTVEEDRWREAERICRNLPPRPITRRESETLQADPDYDVYWVRGHYGQGGKTFVTQLVVLFNHAHVFALSYAMNAEQWEVVVTDGWPVDVQRISGGLDSAASPTADWHTPVADSFK